MAFIDSTMRFIGSTFCTERRVVEKTFGARFWFKTASSSKTFFVLNLHPKVWCLGSFALLVLYVTTMHHGSIYFQWEALGQASRLDSGLGRKEDASSNEEMIIQ